MRIAQISPLIESVPPKAYGGTERIVSYLTEGLVERGHDVTLFASGDSKTGARLIPCSEKGLRIQNSGEDSLVHHLLQTEKAAELAYHFDVLHFHTDYLHFPVSKRSHYAHLTTLHGRLDLPELKPLYHTYRDIPLVSISHHQRLPIKEANWVATIYHGLPLEKYKPNFSEGKYLAFLGRISVEKRVDRAIEIAKKSGMPLKIAAKVDPRDVRYYESIKHLLDHPLVEFIGEIGEDQKPDFLGNAAALLFPIDWPEPFGLVMIEAMAFGTPVIAFRNGSVPEIVDEGVTGTIVSTIGQAAESVKNIHRFKRSECRRMCEERYDVHVMVKNYERTYDRISGGRKKLYFQGTRTIHSE